MNITITMSFNDLQKIISESVTMQALVNGNSIKDVNPIVSFKDNWFKQNKVSSMDEHQKNFTGCSKIAAIKAVREHFAYSKDKAFAAQVFKEKYDTRLSPLDETILSLSGAKQLVEKYFY
jgi:hypothetical protein